MKNVLIILFALISFSSLAQTNQGGIITEENGLQTGIEIDVPTDGAINIPHVRKCKIRSVTFTENLNVQMVLEFNYYTSSGMPMLKAIESDSTLTAEMKEYRKRLFTPHIIAPKSTTGALIDVTTKEVLVGDPLPGHTYIPEIMMYQQMTRQDLQNMGVTGAAIENRPLQLVHKFFGLAAYKTLVRNGLISQ